MHQRSSVRISILAFSVIVLAGAAFAAEPAVGTRVEGEIKNVDLSGTPRHIVVGRPDGTGDVFRVRIHSSTRIMFESDSGGLPEEIGSLKPGMRVRVRYPGDKPAERIHVTFVPDAIRDQARRGDFGLGSADSGAAAGDLKVRLIDVDEGRGEFTADVAGKTQRFEVRDPRMLARFDAGDMVIITVDDEADTTSRNPLSRLRQRAIVTDIRSADLFGRVIDVSGIRVRVSVDGREESFRVEKADVSRLRSGDHIRFEVEERAGGERVVTRIDLD